jgi:hypothetical protein
MTTWVLYWNSSIKCLGRCAIAFPIQQPASIGSHIALELPSSHSVAKRDNMCEEDMIIRSVVSADPEKDENMVLKTHGSSLSLPPVDGGIHAWLFLAGCYVMEALVFGKRVQCALFYPLIIDTMLTGFGFSFGVLQDYYSSNAPFAGSGGVAVIGTLTTVSSNAHIVFTTNHLICRVLCSLVRHWCSRFVGSILAGRAGSLLWGFSCASYRL